MLRLLLHNFYPIAQQVHLIKFWYDSSPTQRIKCHWLFWWLILCVNVARLWYPVVWLTISLDVAEKVFF